MMRAAALICAVLALGAEVPCDPVVEHPFALIPSYVSNPPENETADNRAAGWRMYVRREGETQWFLIADESCRWYDDDGYPISPMLDPARRHCQIDSEGWPPLREYDPNPRIWHELVTTWTNEAGESGHSNIARWCPATWCEPDHEDPAQCPVN